MIVCILANLDLSSMTVVLMTAFKTLWVELQVQNPLLTHFLVELFSFKVICWLIMTSQKSLLFIWFFILLCCSNFDLCTKISLCVLLTFQAKCLCESKTYSHILQPVFFIIVFSELLIIQDFEFITYLYYSNHLHLLYQLYILTWIVLSPWN